MSSMESMNKNQNLIEPVEWVNGIEGRVHIQKIDVNTGKVVEDYHTKNRLVLRYHVVLTHLLSPVGNFNNQSVLSGALFNQLGNPSSSDLKLTKMRFGTDATATRITMSGLLAPVAPLFNGDGTPTSSDAYAIDTYRFLNGAPVNDPVAGSVPDFDQALVMEATMAGPAGNGTGGGPVIYREAGLFTANDIMFARTNLPNLTKDQNFAFKFSYQIRFP